MNNIATQFTVAAVCIFLGHILRNTRWMLLLRGRTSHSSKLLLPSGIGHLTDLLLPWRLGDVVRTFSSYRRLGLEPARVAASVVVERISDVIVIGIVSISFGQGAAPWSSDKLQYLMRSYTVALSTVVFLVFLAHLFSFRFKRTALRVSQLFHPRIQSQLLMFFFVVRDTKKSMLRGRTGGLFLGLSVAMWGCYFIGYLLFLNASESTQLDPILSLFEVRTLLTPRVIQVTLKEFLILFSPSLLLLIPFQKLFGAETSSTPGKSFLGKHAPGHLPFANEGGRMEFLAKFFGGLDNEWCDAYRNIYRDVTIESDVSGLSEATTVIVQDEVSHFYRKHQIGEGCLSLQSQCELMEKLVHYVPVAEVIHKGSGSNYFFYDMPCNPNAVPLSRAIEFLQIDEALELITRVVHQVSNVDFVNIDSIDFCRFKTSKIDNSIGFLSMQSEIEGPVNSPMITVNGKVLRGLRNLISDEVFQSNLDFLRHETPSFTHGDLTFDNIIIDKTSDHGFYLIDPLPDNLISTFSHDLSKLLQSTVTRQGLTRLYTCSPTSKNSYSLKIVDDPKLHAVTEEFLKKFILDAPLRLHTALKIRLIIHWLRILVHRSRARDPMLETYAITTVVICNNILNDLAATPEHWRSNYALA